MVILNPRVSTLKVWIVFCLGNNFLIKSILTGCGIVPSYLKRYQEPGKYSIVPNKRTYLNNRTYPNFLGKTISVPT